MQAGQGIEQGEKVVVVLLLPFRPFERSAQIAHRLLDGAAAVTDHERADCCAADHGHFEGQGLDDHAELAARGDVSSEHGGEDDDNADNGEHGARSFCQ